MNEHAEHIAVFDGNLDWSVEHPQSCREHPARPMSDCPTSRVMRALSAPPVLEPGRYRLVGEGVITFEESGDARPRGTMERVRECMADIGSPDMEALDAGLKEQGL